ncbi:MAG: tRNA (cytidine(34)-2'-O)-methyltransferase [Fibrobacterota bacterium]|nr:tRNA (cytidine(34)-2'-O)-methyltransferase [Fibrobacterota bacterium]QQS07429.1 MAG: tRNA (cytidine(34)-2'-O)-methyltransferase [Fibrobacterota bacterium]
MLKIVLVQPEIAPNTGNIARLCVCNGLQLHLVHPLGFKIDDRNLKRAGMDYWKHLDLVEHTDVDAFLHALPVGARLRWFSTKSDVAHWDLDYKPDDWLVYGSESRGLPERLRELHPEGWVRIPMTGPFVRSLNLSSSVAIGAYEALRQTSIPPTGVLS